MKAIAILGFGTVGSGVYEVLKKAEDIQIQYIVDLRAFPEHPLADRVTSDFEKVLADERVEVVVETMGGVKIAYDYTKRALLAGKSVVTSNKAVVDACGEELESIARQKGVSYLYEASVGGGIPILRPLRDCFAADRVLKISGILNGTTNYILTRMAESGCSMEEALAEAQALGYAEQDPTADVEGHDAARKICILAGLAFGRYIPYTEVKCLQGIRDVTVEDVRLAAERGCVIRLLGTAERVEVGGEEHLRLAVAPYLVPEDNLLHAVRGAFNAISVVGESVGEVLFYGQGAGSLPTASAVACDVFEALYRKPAPALRNRLEAGYVLPDCASHRTAVLPNGKTYFAL